VGEAASRGANFLQRHFFDYPPGPLRLWFAITCAGALALCVSLWHVAGLRQEEVWPVILGVCFSATAALFPLNLPRSKYSVAVADVFVFSVLATVGPAGAVLAAGAEGAVGALRTSKRLSSQLMTPALGMACMGACSQVFVAGSQASQALGCSPAVSDLLALCLSAVIYCVLTTSPVMWIQSSKRGHRLRPGDWFNAASWMLAMGLASAFVAGLLNANAQYNGRGVLVIAAGIAIMTVLLLRYTLNHQEAERSAQEARIAEAQHEAELNQQRFTAAFTHAAIGMAIVTPQCGMLQTNEALRRLLGRSEPALLALSFDSLWSVGDAALLRRHADQVLAESEDSFSMELSCQRPDGKALWLSVHCSRYTDPGGAGPCLIYQLHDITSRQEAESRLQHIAYHDGLTDLANRSCFHERLELAVERSRTDAAHRFAVMFLDLDRFKVVNDSLGHIAGNLLLREVAQRLRRCMRPDDLVARLGGDEFAILAEQLQDTQQGVMLADRVLQALVQPVSINGTEVLPGVSVGITFSDLGYRTVDEVLRDADLAMYEAKANGRGRVAVFDISMHERVAEKLALEADLRHAIGEGQLKLMFQPLYRLQPFGLYGFEALARWDHPTRGPVSPEVFIALAEEAGHIEHLTAFVIDQAVAQLAAWRNLAPHLDDLGMHVNISGRDLARHDLAEQVQATLQRHALPARNLTLEITETVLMGRLDVALQTLGRLRSAGVQCSIDDFGTGYSSLSYLSTLPIDSLKIDRSFVMGMHEQPQNVEIVRAVLNLGQSLGRQVIAEGIETPRQLAALREMGVPIGQGYLLSRPLRAKEVELMLLLSASEAAAARAAMA
jgi:diguanylate cyclase (GGDEF)-like protein/PAS domain S-box-containing protein